MITTRALAGVGLAVLCVGALGQSGEEPTFHDRKGDFEISHGKSLSLLNKGDTTVVVFIGKPLTGFSKSQGLSFSANRVKATLKANDGAQTIQEGLLTGAVRLTRSSDDKKGSGSGTLTSERVEYGETDAGGHVRLTVPFAYSYTGRTEDGRPQSMKFSAPSGTADFSPTKEKSKQPLRHATASGPVSVVFDSVKKSDAAAKQHMTATGDHMEFDAGTHKLTIEGHVKLKGQEEGADNTFYLNTSFERVVIELDDSMNVTGYEAGSGDATVGDKDGG